MTPVAIMLTLRVLFLVIWVALALSLNIRDACHTKLTILLQSITIHIKTTAR
jgi:hypothetical protein